MSNTDVEHIKIRPVSPKTQYVGNGRTREFQTVFAFFAEDNIVVYLNDKIISSGFKITGVGNSEGGTVTFDVAPKKGENITIIRDIVIERITDFQEGGTFRAKNINDEFDRLTAVSQQVNEVAKRAIVFPPFYADEFNPELPRPEAKKALVWNDSGTALRNSVVDFDQVESDTKKYRDEALAARDAAKVSEENAKASENVVVAKVDGFDARVDEATNTFDRNYNDKLVAFNINAVNKQNDFDVNAATLTARYDNNDLAKTKAFNENAQTMTDGFNTNAMLKVDDFDAHAAVKEMEFDDNADAKISEYNANDVNKTKAYNDNATAKQAQVDASASMAKQSELNAKASEDAAKNSENASGISEDNARESERLAREYKEAAELSATNAKKSEDNAKVSENNSSTSENNASTSEQNAATSETNALQSASDANLSAEASKTSEVNAKDSEIKAKASEDKCIELVNSLQNVYKFKGSVPTYDDLPKTDNVTGDVWNVLDSDINYAWTGTDWDALGGASTDLSDYVTKQLGMLLARDEDVNSSKTFLKDQAIKSPDLDITTDRSKRGNGLIFTDKNGTQTAGIGVYINNNQSPECRFVASNGTKSAFAGLGVTTDGQGFFEIPEPSDTSDNNDAVSSRWVNKKVNTKQDKLSTAQIIATNSGITAAKVETYDGYNATINSKQTQLNATQLKAVNSGIDNAKITKYDGYEATINGKQPKGDYATKTELSTGLSSKQNNLTSGQLNACNSGITSAKVKTYDGYQGQINSKASVDLDNLSEAGEKHFLGNNTISNCITEIPQDIKLELKDGTLTLKAGSKVYVPNGVGKFDVINISRDITTTYIDNQPYFAFVKSNGTELEVNTVRDCNSGETDTGSSWHVWYDTRNNKIKRFNNSGTVIVDGMSFPICIYNGDTKITSIDQVFNGFGYIGNTVYALPGVKGLIPNGRNADGSLRNINITLNQIISKTFPSNINGEWVLQLDELGIAHVDKAHYFEQYNEPTGILGWTVWLNTKNNIPYLREIGNPNSRWTPQYLLNNFIVVSSSSGRITSFNPKQVFHAVDYNDFESLDNNSLKAPDFTKGVSMTDNVGRGEGKFTAPANGWYYCINATDNYNQGIEIYINDKQISGVFGSAYTNYSGVVSPVGKGDVIHWKGAAGNITSRMRFYPNR